MSIKRCLVAPLNYSHRQRGQVEAFETMFGRDNVREFDWMALHRQGENPNDRLVTSALEFKPDWIWLQVQSGSPITEAAIQKIRAALPHCLITHWMGDCRLSVSAELAAICRATHATLISSVGQIPLYGCETMAPRVEYVQIGLDPEDLPDAPDWTPPFAVPEVVFAGGYYDHVKDFARGTAARLAAVDALARAGIDVGVVGTGWPKHIRTVGQCHVKQSAAVYRRAKVVLAINHMNDIERYYSDRLLIALASGTAVVAHYVPGLEKEFHQGHDLFWVDNPLELVERVTYLLAGDAPSELHGYRGMTCEEHRLLLGNAGQHRAVREHTWNVRLEALAPKANQWHQELR